MASPPAPWTSATRSVTGQAAATETPIGFVPTAEALDTSGLDIDSATLAELLKVDAAAWSHEVALIEQHFASIGERLPAEMATQLDALAKRLER